MSDPEDSSWDRGPVLIPVNAAWRIAVLLALWIFPGLHPVNAQAGASGSDPLSAAWTAVGPSQIASLSFGEVTGRVTAVAIDPADPTGNTVYLGTTGGGVWKSVNAAGGTSDATFVPLTDTLPVFSANAGSAAIPALSIGAIALGNGVVLAGTGDANNASDSYYGEGILRSADGGVTWTLAQESHDGVAGNHTFVGLGVAGIAWSTTTPGLVVAALSQSAEGVLVNAPDATYSVMGLYYSSDAGVSWQMATIKDGSQIVQQPLPGGAPGNAATAVAWNPVRQMFYAAVQFHGYYASSDGITWTRLGAQPGTGLTTIACPTNPGSIGSSTCPIFRGALAVQPETGDTFALTVDSNNLDQGISQDACALSSSHCTDPVGFVQPLDSSALEADNGSDAIPQAGYDLSLAAVADGADTLLFAGTVDLYRCSLAAGCVWRNTTNAQNGCAAPAMVAPAQHAIAALASAGSGGMPIVYVGNDGGLWRSMDGVNQQQTPCSPDDQKHFQNLNSELGSLAEVVNLAQHPTNPATLLVGLGTNGTAGTAAAPTASAWPQLSAGEGGTVAIDPVNPQNWYASTAAGVNVDGCGSGSACTAANFAGMPTIGYAQVDDDAALVAAPFLLDPVLTSNVLVGTCRVWRGDAQSGSGWSGSNAISPKLGSGSTGTCEATDGMVRSLAAGGPASSAANTPNAGSTALYAGMAGALDGGGSYAGQLFANYAAQTASSTTPWIDVANSPVTNDTSDAGVFNPGGFDISSVVADVHDATGKTVYATVKAFAANGVNAPHVYRSTNGGASWTNISSNLPNAPANGMVIDPNDANTVYVAMDTGVYATIQVATCTTANCWSVYGLGLPNSPVLSLAAAAGMATGDGRNGELRAATYGRGVWQIPLLTASAAAVPAITVNPEALTFPNQAVGTESAAQSIAVTNSGTAALTVSQIVMSGDFTETDNCAGTVAIGATCTVQVLFLPAATGTQTGQATIYGNAAGGQATIALSGVGLPAASVVLNPIAATYSSTTLGSSSAAQDITISNTGGVAVTLQAPAVTGDFEITANTCGPTLAPSVGCTVSVAFQPTASGTRTGSFSVTDSVGIQTTSLVGVGVLPATDALSPLTLTFAPQQLNTGSATQQVMLTNSGDAALTLIAAQITSDSFTVVNGCGNSLNGHSTCSMLVAFAPTTAGSAIGVLTVTDEYRSQAVSLSGVGVAPAGVSLSPTSTISFAATGVGLSAASQRVTLTNNGGVTLLIQNIAAAGDFLIAAGSNTCGASLAPANQCTLQILFSPTAAGARIGTLTVVDSAASSPQILQLTGTGIDFSLAPNGSTTQTISPGGDAVYPLLLSSIAGVPGTVAFSCTGAPAYSTCIVNPLSGALGGTETISVTVATDVASLRPSETPSARPAPWLVLLLPVGLLVLAGRDKRPSLILLLVCLCVLSGCQVSRTIPLTSTNASGGTSTTPTPTGTYNLQVAGASAGLTRTVALTLVVQ